MSIMDKIRGVFGGGDNDDYYDDNDDYIDEVAEEGYTEEPAAPRGTAVPLKTSSARPRGRSSIVVKTPESFEDGKVIADLLKQRSSVVFNLGMLSREEGSRLIDFLLGASYMSNSELKYTGNMTFLIAPIDVDVVVQAPAGGETMNPPDFFP